MSSSNEGFITNPSKRNHPSSSKSTKNTSPITTQPKTKKLFSTLTRYEPLTQTEQTESADMITEADIVSEAFIITDHIKPPPQIFMKGVLDFPGSVLI